MRPLEIILVLILLLYTLRSIRDWRLPVSQAGRWLPLIGVGVLLLHLLVEKYRWQMIPLYTFTFLAAAVTLRPPSQPGDQKSRWTPWRSAGAVLALGASAALPALLPIPQAPVLTGPYQVGTVTHVLEDTNRQELYAPGLGGPRRYMIQIWYPAQPAGWNIHAPWMPEAGIVAPAIARWYDLPPFFLDHLSLVRSAAYQDANLADAGVPYPVLLFSHGWSGFRAQNSYQMQELASHGYVVVGIDHTYGAVATVFPDGEVAYNNPAALPRDLKPEEEYIAAARLLANQWTGDLSYALDYLASLNANDPSGRFSGALDLANVGVIGHSTGGGAAIQFCATDLRCRSGLAMDAFMTPVSAPVLDGGLAQPFLFLFSEQWPSEKNTRLFERFYSHVENDLGVWTILGTAHTDFSDMPLLSPLAPQLGLTGPLAGERVLEIISFYSVTFFDNVLKDQPTGLFSGANNRFPEVRAWQE